MVAAARLGDEGNLALSLTRGLHGDLDVLAEGGEKVHETLNGKGTGAIAHQGGNVRLIDAENLAGFSLLEAAFFDEAVDLQSKLGFQELLLGMREAKVGKNIAAALLDANGFSCSGRHRVVSPGSLYINTSIHIYR